MIFHISCLGMALLSTVAMAFSPFLMNNSPLRLRTRIHSQVEDNEEDWRNFRAKLVMKYRQDSGSSSTVTNIDDSRSNVDGAWAYESGNAIEKGSIILSRAPDTDGSSDPESGLAQQFFHKSIILVLGEEI